MTGQGSCPVYVPGDMLHEVSEQQMWNEKEKKIIFFLAFVQSCTLKSVNFPVCTCDFPR